MRSVNGTASVVFGPSALGAGGVNILPRGRQAIEKRAEVVSSPCRRLAVAIAYRGELLLHISDCFQQRDGIECSEPLAQLIFDHLVNIRRGQ